MSKAAAAPNIPNPLGTAPVGRLIFRFAVPSIIGWLVSAAYNIIDQIYIGQGVGMLGNAATNVAFPLTTASTAVALLLGVGSASNFNLEQGRGNSVRAARIAGTGISLMTVSGVVLAALVIAFLRPLLLLFGSTPTVLPLALTYTGITTLGIPLAIFTTACSQLVRADGSPAYAMYSLASGAVLNMILDPIFIFWLDMGIAGAAWATVISQALSAVMVILYLPRFKTIRLTRRCFRPQRRYIRSIASLGAAASFNQIAMTIVQITMNNTLTRYGAQSMYGSDIPLAVVGVISKVNVVYMAFTLGIAQGCQPIAGFNYGARKYGRVKKTYLTAAKAVTLISVAAFLCFQIFPRSIIAIFGNGSEAYFHFAERYFRIFMALTFLNGIQPLTSNFFTSIGKAKMGILLSTTRQILFLLPLIIALPRFMGIDGVMFAGPIADSAAVTLAVILIVREFRRLDRKIRDETPSIPLAARG